MIKTQAQLEAAEKALSQVQMEVLKTLRKGAIVKSINAYLGNYHIIEFGGKDLGNIDIRTVKKLHKLGFLKHVKEWPYTEDYYFLDDLSWIKQ